MRAGRKAGGSDIPDDLFLLHGSAFPNAGGKAAQMPVEGLIPLRMFDHDLLPIPPVPTAGDDGSVGHGPDRGPRRRGIIDCQVRAVPSQDGVGPGTGMSLLIAMCSALAVLVGLSGYFVRPIRDAETVLPDHKPLPAPESASA